MWQWVWNGYTYVYAPPQHPQNQLYNAGLMYQAGVVSGRWSSSIVFDPPISDAERAARVYCKKELA